MTHGFTPALQRHLEEQRGGLGLTLRVAGYAAIWWMLTGGDAHSWLWGLPAIIAAALFNPFPTGTRWRLRLTALLRFIAIFVWFSLRSALDVAWRATHPRRPLDPALLDYPWQLPPGRARVFLANVINLMPGTLCVGIGEHALTVHVLGRPMRVLEDMQRLEQRVAGLLASAKDSDE